MILPPAIADCISTRRYPEACALAVEIPNPRDHRDAMIAINRAMRENPADENEDCPMHKPTFELDAHEAKLTSYTPRREIHGEDPKPAASLAFSVNLGAEDLAMFSPTLRSSFYYKASDEGRGDMVDRVADAADLRFPEIEAPFKWTKTIVGAELDIDHGLGGSSDIKLPTCDVDDFKLQPMQGGQAIVSFRVACHPDQRQSGQLAFLIGETVKITLTPPDVDLADAAA